MAPSSRREFLSDVGRGMLVAGLGPTVAGDLGFSTAYAEEGADSLSFGKYDRLVDLLQSTPLERLQPLLVRQLRDGQCDLPTLMGAAALANAETFGGEDYVGYHTAMAMLPALEMVNLLPTQRQPLPVLKVLYRNSQQIQQTGGATKKTLTELPAKRAESAADLGLEIRNAARQADMKKAEELFATQADAPLEQAFNALQPAVQDDVNVHRFVLAHRTYGLVGLLGKEHAHTLLRQCVRFCVDNEQRRISRNRPQSAIRDVLPKLLDEYRLDGKKPGARDPGDSAVAELSLAIYNGPPAQSADAVAAALADGIDPEVVGEAVSLASNLLTLRQGEDKWRTHGDAAGVHAADATNAWRNMARVTDHRHAVSGLIVAAYHSASHSPFKNDSYPTEEHLAAVKTTDAKKLLEEAQDAVCNNDQQRAAAAIEIFGRQGHSPQAVFDAMLKYTISEDGRLHGEKFFHTVREEYRTVRPAFRWRLMVALARVTASAYGYNRNDKNGFRAPGYEEACGLLGVEV